MRIQRYDGTGTLLDNLTHTIAGTSNRLTSLADAVGVTAETWDAEAESFTYDANGNQLTTPAPYSLTASTYDYQNLPLSFTRSGTTTTYRYNEVGQRIAKQVGAGNTEVYLLEDRVPLGVYTVNAAGAVVSSYFNLLADTRVVGRQPSAGSRSYYHTDLLGSTRAVVQGATVTESDDYDPWGVLMPGRTLGSGTKEQFTTKERDAETGLDYFGARLYASAIARWTTVDPAVAADSTPEWGPYGYVKGGPASAVDLDGRCDKEKPWCQFLRNFLRGMTVVSSPQGGSCEGPGCRTGALVGLILMVSPTAKLPASGAADLAARDGVAANAAGMSRAVSLPGRVVNLKADAQHAFSNIVDNYADDAVRFSIPTRSPGGTVSSMSELRQIEGSLNGTNGIFEWVIREGRVVHRRFIPGGSITGTPNQVVR